MKNMSEQRKPLLIVEDDPTLQKQMQWAFDQYDTVVANDRASAIAQVRRFEPAVITMDLGLPPSPDDPAEGLKLLEEGNFLRNPNDHRDKNTPDPPQPKDEFVLKFVKP